MLQISLQTLHTSTAGLHRQLPMSEQTEFLQCISSEVPKVAYPIAVLSSLIDTMFGASESVDIRDVISYITSNDDVPLPESKEDLDQLLYSLSRYSDIVYLPNLNSRSWIIVNVLRYLEMLLTHARPPASPELEASFLGHLGFHTDTSSDIKKLACLYNCDCNTPGCHRFIHTTKTAKQTVFNVKVMLLPVCTATRYLHARISTPYLPVLAVHFI